MGHILRSNVADLDSHWYPVSLQCGHCSSKLQYDLVIKMENLQAEWGLLSSMSGLSLPPLPHMNVVDGTAKGEG